MEDVTPLLESERLDYLARESRARVDAAWLELIEAAKTEPKAREFLKAFAAEAMRAGAGPGEGISELESPQRSLGQGISSV